MVPWMQQGQSDIANWVESWVQDDPVITTARARAAEVGVAALDATSGTVLRFITASTGARSVVELGTGAGVSSLWLLSGMPADGVLTSIDPEVEHQRLARQSLTEAGYGSGRVRLIAGRALEVLPKLSDGAYDLVFCDAEPAENTLYLTAALRLLKPGGVVVFARALNGGRVADQSARDADTVALRELTKTIKEHEDLTPALLPVGTGLLVAVLS
jgi:predicted O-methyltransferase YrrM